ncbi:alcohol oxidase [Pholiota conissans]|uniref:pyranose dehydrogenase (acceptor) n=1 Tax=Pholiota conissans TaxID=109636 RepID=A0A9P6CWV7_9AGAR|nr:alcohol oxidase [Pholiota conissans]
MQPIKLFSFVLATLAATPSFAVTITQPSQLTTLTYDYVIIGAGNAGLVIASRLTENPNVSVLVLEAGVSDQGVILAEAPFLGPTLTPNTIYDWNYTITAQTGMDGKTFAYPRGRLLGGSSSANYCFHQWGTNEDWDRLAALSGDPGWAWSNMRNYIQKHEKLVPPADGHDTTGQIIPALHGTHGMLPVSMPANNQTIDPRVLLTTQQLSAEFPINHDMSGGDHSLLGIGWVKSSAAGGVRSSSSTTYLAAANSRPNLTVLINAYVTKLIQTGTASRKAFRSVQFKNSPGTGTSPAGATVVVNARKEVILSAGSVGTAQILQLSGIGNKNELQTLGITSVLNNPDVGENLSDHTLLPNIFSVRGDDSFDHILRSNSLVGDEVTDWVTNKTGMFINNVVNNFGFARIPSNASIFSTTTDPAPGPTSPHWEIITSNFFFSPGFNIPATGSFMTVVAVLLTPQSRGTIKLASSNPFDHPLINPNYLTKDFDIFTMREAVKAIKRFIGAPAWSDYVIGPYGDSFIAATDDASIDAYVRGLMTTIFHPVGTASMSKATASGGVVNPDLKLKGADGIRVVDASVFPYVPSAHTQGPVYLLAERAADIIKAQNQ